VLLRIPAAGSVQAVGHGMTKPQRWPAIDSAKFARWLVRHLWGELLHSQIPATLTGITHDVTAGTAGGGGLHGGTEARRHGGQDCHFIRKCTDNCKLQLFSCFQSLKQIPSAKQLHNFSRIWLRGLLRAYALLCCIREGSASCSFPPSVSPSTQVIFKSTQSLK